MCIRDRCKADGGIVAELVGFASDNDEGGLALWDGGVKKVFLTSNGYSWFMNGNVGINTTTPQQKLVSYADSGYPFVANGPSNCIALNNAGVIVFGTKDVAQYASGSFDATDYTFKSSGTPKFTMSSAGQFVLASGGIDFNTPGTGTFYNPGLSDATGFNFLSNQIIAYTANTPVLHINSNGNIGINQSSPQANAKLHVQGNVGSSGYFYTTSTSSPQTDFTSSQASNKAGLLLHRLSETNGDYCGMEFHTHPSSITTYRKGGIYYQANGTGFGRGDIVFANDNAGDTGLVSPTDHKFRIKNDGSLRAFTASNAVSCFSNYDHGNVDFNHRENRVLTSNAHGWDGNANSDGADPILVLAVENRAGNSDIGDAYGLALHSESQDDNDFGPLIGWTNRSNSGSYTTTYAAIVGKKTGQATDANWSAGELHFHTNKPAGFYADPNGSMPSDNYAGYMNSNPDLRITAEGYVATHRNPAFAAHGAGGFIISDGGITLSLIHN